MPRLTYTAPEDAEPWDRLTGETQRAFNGFVIYKDLPKDERSLPRVCSELNRGADAIAEWSSRYVWRARVAAWENHLEAAKNNAAVEEARKLGERQARHLAGISHVMFLPVKEMIERLEGGRLQLGGLTDQEVMRLVDMAARAYPNLAQAERLIRGQSTQIVEPVASMQPDYVMPSEQVSEFWGAMEQAGVSPDDLVPSDLSEG